MHIQSWFFGIKSIYPNPRYYKENIPNTELADLDRFPIDIPVGLAAFPEELFTQPKNFLTNKYRNILSYSDMPEGGHFAAFEQPKLLYNDFVQFVKKVEISQNNDKTEL